MAPPGCIFDQNHFTDTNYAPIAIACRHLEWRVQIDHILPAWRRMQRYNAGARTFDKDNCSGRKRFGRLNSPGRQVSALDLDLTEM